MSPERAFILVLPCLRVVIFLLLITTTAFPQVLRDPDPSLQVSRTKSAFILVFIDKGSFLIDDHILAEGNAGDTVIIVNINPDIYSLAFRSGEDIQQQTLKAELGDIIEIRLSKNFIRPVSGKFLQWYEIENRAAGVNEIFLIPGTFFFMAEVVPATLELRRYYGADFGFFTTFNISGGYQAAQGFFVGLGLSILYTDIPVLRDYSTGSEKTYYLDNVSLMPIYLEIRTHMSKRRVAPYFRFALGANAVLTNKEVTYQFDNGYAFQNNRYLINGGGMYISPGFGMRIAINTFLSVLCSADFSFYGPSIKYNTSQVDKQTLSTLYSYESENRLWLTYFGLKLGIGFQAKKGK